jgi:hypothetical protein
MSTLNEEINRIKSLFTEERLYGNLVKKEVITEQGRKVLKLGRRMWDDAITAMKKANKSIPDIPQATKDKFFTSLDNVKKLDDMKTIVQNKEFNQMWKIMGFSEDHIDNLEFVLTTHRDDLGKMVGGYPAYAYITKTNNLREDMITLFFLNADDATRNKFLNAHYDGVIPDALKNIKPNPMPLHPKGSVYGTIGNGNMVINEILYIQSTGQYVTLVKTKSGLRPFYMRTGTGTRAGDGAEGWATKGRWVPFFGNADIQLKPEYGKQNLNSGWFIKPQNGRQGLNGDDIISKDLGEVLGINQKISGDEYSFGVPNKNITNIPTSSDINKWLRSKGYDPSNEELTRQQLKGNPIWGSHTFEGMP